MGIRGLSFSFVGPVLFSKVGEEGLKPSLHGGFRPLRLKVGSEVRHLWPRLTIMRFHGLEDRGPATHISITPKLRDAFSIREHRGVVSVC